MSDAIGRKRRVSFFNLPSPDGDRAHLGTGIYEDVFVRNVSALRIVCFFNHATNAYVHSFATFSRAHFHKSKNDLVCDYDSPFERIGGPLWLVGMADRLISVDGLHTP
ncbi:hypothetical protein [Dyella silvatica]|uniref:hypothetical protein n=1 Tax=Dyella silvatica TaxID=2992128 RepID=UPI002258B683|nr:hypothetical protein [Dyella silvatica]